MPAFLVQIDGYDPVAAAAVTVRLSSVDDDRVCHLNGQTWWPAIAQLPELRYDLVDAAFSGRIDTPASQLTMTVEPFPNLPRYTLADARVQLWEGEPGAAWASYTLRFDGRATGQARVTDGRATLPIAVDDRWLEAPLLSLYAGTTGAEGTSAQKGKPKPLSLGAPRFAAAELVDPTNLVFQLSSYGLIEEVEAAYERILAFGASAGDYASYAALIAASIPAGRWATCKAQGLVRHGAPPVPGGRFVYHVKGDRAGPDGWVRTPGQMIKRIALIGGGTGRFSEASLDALDAARPWNLSWQIAEQITVREAIQRIAASVNAAAGVSWLSQLFVAPLPALPGTASVTLDATGASLPAVAKVEQVEMDPPFWRMAIETEISWDVHQLSEIAFTAQLVDTGAYVSTKTYREGNIAQDQNLSWLYINPTPASGNAPPTLPTSSNSWWKALSPTSLEDMDPDSYAAIIALADDLTDLEAVVDGKITTFFQSSTPTAEGVGDLWFKTDTQKWYRWTAGAWTLTEDAGVGQAIAAAATAQSTANGKVTTFYQTTAPVALATGDLWIDSDESPKRVRRWSGSAWVVMTPASLAELDTAASAFLDGLVDDAEAAADDNVLRYREKIDTLIPAVEELQDRYDVLTARAAALGLSTTTAAAARTRFLTYLASQPTAWYDPDVDTILSTPLFSAAEFPGSWTHSGTTATPTGDYQRIDDNSAGAFEFMTRSAVINATTALTALARVKKDGFPGSTRTGLLRVIDHVGATIVGVIFDTQSGAVTSTEGTSPDYGVLSADNNDWLVYLQAPSAARTNAGVALYPAVGTTGGGFIAATTGYIDVKHIVLVSGVFDQLGRDAFRYRIKDYRNELELLRKAISEAAPNFEIPGQIDIDANSSDVTTTSLPFTVRCKAWIGATNMSADSSFSLGTLPVGLSATINNTPGSADRGLITITVANAGGNIPVNCTIPGYAEQTKQIPVVRTTPPPAQSGGTGATTATDTTFADITSTSHAAIGGPMTVRSTAGGALTYSASTKFRGSGTTASQNIAIKAQYRTPVGSGGWNDFAAETTGSASDVDTETGVVIKGNVAITEATKTGLTASTDYEVQQVGRRTLGSATINCTNANFTVRQ